jgi:hypothetical protein
MLTTLARFANNFVVWECLRDEEFAPLKNAEGAKGRLTHGHLYCGLFQPIFTAFWQHCLHLFIFTILLGF